MALSAIERLKRIGKEALLLPGTGVYMLSALIFGSKEPVGDIFAVKEENTAPEPAPNPRQHQSQKQHQHQHKHQDHLKPQREEKSQGFPGLFGLLGTVLTKMGQAITTFVKNNRAEIAAVIWISLIVGAAVALTVAFWPAALAALAGLSIGGLSIAGIVGASYIAQVLAIGTVASFLTGLAVGALATAVNLGMKVRNYFYPETAPKNEPKTERNEGGPSDGTKNKQGNEPPVHHNHPLNPRGRNDHSVDAMEVDLDVSQSLSLSNG